MTEIRHSSRARRDLIEIWLHIGNVNQAAADRVLRRLEARIEILRHFPEAGPLRAALGPEARILVEPPYLIFYRVVGEGVQIVRVVRSARRISPTMFLEGLE